MVRYYKQVSGEYIIAVGTGNIGIEITESEYNEILSVIANKPTPAEGYDYQLKTDLTWELYEVEQGEDEPTAEEIVSILTGEAE